MIIYWRLNFCLWRAWYCQNPAFPLVASLNAKLNSKANRWIINRVEQSVTATKNDSQKSYHVLERELGLLTAFLNLADGCESFRDLWTVRIRDLSMWQCLLALPPWFFNPQSPYLKFSSALLIYHRLYDMWSLKWGVEDRELKFYMKKV